MNIAFQNYIFVLKGLKLDNFLPRQGFGTNSWSVGQSQISTHSSRFDEFSVFN